MKTVHIHTEVKDGVIRFNSTVFAKNQFGNPELLFQITNIGSVTVGNYCITFRCGESTVTIHDVSRIAYKRNYYEIYNLKTDEIPIWKFVNRLEP